MTVPVPINDSDGNLIWNLYYADDYFFNTLDEAKIFISKKMVQRVYYIFRNPKDMKYYGFLLYSNLPETC